LSIHKKELHVLLSRQNMQPFSVQIGEKPKKDPSDRLHPQKSPSFLKKPHHFAFTDIINYPFVAILGNPSYQERIYANDACKHDHASFLFFMRTGRTSLLYMV
jgi:hypothetical protein